MTEPQPWTGTQMLAAIHAGAPGAPATARHRPVRLSAPGAMKRKTATCAWAIAGRRAGSRTRCGAAALPKRAVLRHPYCARHLAMVLARVGSPRVPPLLIHGMTARWRGISPALQGHITREGH